MLLGYIRYSRNDPDYGKRQHLDLLQYGVEERNIFQDKASEHFHKRAALNDCLTLLKPGDTLVVAALDRLGSGAGNLLEIFDKLLKNEISLEILDNSPIQIGPARSVLVCEVLNALIGYDRVISPKRARAARALDITARLHKRGKMTYEKIIAAQAMLQDREPGTPNYRSQHEICRLLGVTIFTLKRYLKNDGSLTEVGRIYCARLRAHTAKKKQNGAKTRRDRGADYAAHDR